MPLSIGNKLNSLIIKECFTKQCIEMYERMYEKMKDHIYI